MRLRALAWDDNAGDGAATPSAIRADDGRAGALRTSTGLCSFSSGGECDFGFDLRNVLRENTNIGVVNEI